MCKKIKDILDEIKYQLTDKESVFYTSTKILIVIMLWVYPIPFMLLEKTNFKYTGYIYLLTIISIIYFYFIKRNEESKSAFLNFYKSLKEALPYIIGCIILFYLGPALWFNILLNEKKYHQSYVYAFPDKDNAKSYRVKADLEYEYDYDYDEDYGYSKNDYGYQITKIYFDNGGYIEFNFCEKGNNKGNLFYCEADNDNRDWYFRYYGEKVEK